MLGSICSPSMYMIIPGTYLFVVMSHDNFRAETSYSSRVALFSPNAMVQSMPGQVERRLSWLTCNGISHLGTHAAVKATLLAATKRGGGNRSHGRTKRKERKPRTEGSSREVTRSGDAAVSGRISRGRRPRHPYGWHAASWSNGAG